MGTINTLPSTKIVSQIFFRKSLALINPVFSVEIKLCHKMRINKITHAATKMIILFCFATPVQEEKPPIPLKQSSCSHLLSHGRCRCSPIQGLYSAVLKQLDLSVPKGLISSSKFLPGQLNTHSHLCNSENTELTLSQ